MSYRREVNVSAQLIQFIRPAAAKNATDFWNTVFMTFCVTVLLILGSARLAAQPDLPVTQLLFEPVPIPAEGASEGSVNFNSLENMPQLVASDDIGERGIDGADRQQMLSDINDYIMAIGDNEAAEGPYSDQLVQDLYSAGLLYQKLDEHEEALDFFVRAQNISRINAGLQDSMEQAPIIQSKTESLLALGEISEADDTQDGLLQLYKDNYGEESEEIVSAMHSVGDWNMQAFLERSNIALISSRMNVANFMNQSISTADGVTGGGIADQMFAQTLMSTSQPIYKLFQAQNHYFNAINILLKNKNYTHPEILDLEKKLTTTSFLRTHQENIIYEPDFYLERKTSATGTRLDTSSQDVMNSPDYEVGLNSIQRRLSFVSVNPARTHQQVADAMLAEADWHMLFQRKVIARRKYEEIYEFFTANPDFGVYAKDTVYPDIPVVLPTFLPAPNSRERLGIAADDEVNYFGYFDVSFSINRTGKARRIRINGQSGEVTKNMEIRLNQYLQNVLFRPRYDSEGKLDDDQLNLRYYVGI